MCHVEADVAKLKVDEMIRRGLGLLKSEMLSVLWIMYKVQRKASDNQSTDECSFFGSALIQISYDAQCVKPVGATTPRMFFERSNAGKIVWSRQCRTWS